jgi:hypothetical protein
MDDKALVTLRLTFHHVLAFLPLCATFCPPVHLARFGVFAIL